ncbi:unnamed protein product [Coregonus sp. 'balchen']|nr:unnamed protein product [Coregonus sp. 'balchen']
MMKLFEIKFTDKFNSLPGGFWSGIDVWINKQHVVNKQTESKNVGFEEFVNILLIHGCDTSESKDVLSLVNSGIELEYDKERLWYFCVRTLIPHSKVSFLPVEESVEETASLRKNNIYQIHLLPEKNYDWSLGLHLLRPDDWFSDKVAYPKLPWLGGELLPKLVCWATEGKTSEYRSTLSLLPVLWGEERAEKGLTVKQSFVDLGCGNGLLVHILSNEGHPGKGIDVRKRKIWNMYGPQTHLEE